MRGEDPALAQGAARIKAELLQRIEGGAVALPPRNRLQVVARLVDDARDIHRVQIQGKPQHIRKMGDEFRVCIGSFAAQGMVHMEHAHLPDVAPLGQFACDIGQRRGIASTRNHEQHRGIRVGKRSLRDGLRSTLDCIACLFHLRS